MRMKKKIPSWSPISSFMCFYEIVCKKNRQKIRVQVRLPSQTQNGVNGPFVQRNSLHLPHSFLLFTRIHYSNLCEPSLLVLRIALEQSS